MFTGLNPYQRPDLGYVLGQQMSTNPTLAPYAGIPEAAIQGLSFLRTAASIGSNGINGAGVLRSMAKNYIAPRYAKHLEPLAATLEAKSNGDKRPLATILKEKTQDHIGGILHTDELSQFASNPRQAITNRILEHGGVGDWAALKAQASAPAVGLRGSILLNSKGAESELSARREAVLKGLQDHPSGAVPTKIASELADADMEHARAVYNKSTTTPALSPEAAAHPAGKMMQGIWAEQDALPNDDAKRIGALSNTNVFHPTTNRNEAELDLLEDSDVAARHANIQAQFEQEAAAVRAKMPKNLQNFVDQHGSTIQKLAASQLDGGGTEEGLSIDRPQVSMHELGTLAAAHPKMSDVPEIHNAMNNLGREMRNGQVDDLQSRGTAYASSLGTAFRQNLEEELSSRGGAAKHAALARKVLDYGQSGDFHEAAHDVVDVAADHISNPRTRALIRDGAHATINQFTSKDRAANKPTATFKDFLPPAKDKAAPASQPGPASTANEGVAESIGHADGSRITSSTPGTFQPGSPYYTGETTSSSGGTMASPHLSTLADQVEHAFQNATQGGGHKDDEKPTKKGPAETTNKNPEDPEDFKVKRPKVAEQAPTDNKPPAPSKPVANEGVMEEAAPDWNGSHVATVKGEEIEMQDLSSKKWPAFETDPYFDDEDEEYVVPDLKPGESVEMKDMAGLKQHPEFNEADPYFDDGDEEEPSQAFQLGNEGTSTSTAPAPSSEATHAASSEAMPARATEPTSSTASAVGSGSNPSETVEHETSPTQGGGKSDDDAPAGEERGGDSGDAAAEDAGRAATGAAEDAGEAAGEAAAEATLDMDPITAVAGAALPLVMPYINDWFSDKPIQYHNQFDYSQPPQTAASPPPTAGEEPPPPTDNPAADNVTNV